MAQTPRQLQYRLNWPIARQSREVELLIDNNIS